MMTVEEYFKKCNDTRTNEEKIKAIGKCEDNIIGIKNPTREMWKLALMKNGHLIRFLRNPDEELQLIAIKKDPEAIEHIYNPTEKVQLKAITLNALVIQDIKNPSKKIQLEAIRRRKDIFHCIETSDEMQALIKMELL